jgi:hypothetical protein
MIYRIFVELVYLCTSEYLHIAAKVGKKRHRNKGLTQIKINFRENL